MFASVWFHLSYLLGQELELRLASSYLLQYPTALVTESLYKSFGVKIYIKTAPTCFGAITIINERII